MSASIVSDLIAAAVVLVPGVYCIYRVLAWCIEIAIMKRAGYWHDNGFHGRGEYKNPCWRDLAGKRPDVPSRFFIR